MSHGRTRACDRAWSPGPGARRHAGTRVRHGRSGTGDVGHVTVVATLPSRTRAVGTVPARVNMGERVRRRGTRLLLVIVISSSAVHVQGSPPAGCGQIPPVQEPPLAHRPWMNAQLPAANRTRLLLNAMNLTEQIRMLYGNDKPVCGGQRGYTGYVVGNERLGIPHLQMNDGPQGFRIDGGATTTAWPSGINMAASWDVAAVAAWGRGMGTEFAAKGANVQRKSEPDCRCTGRYRR